jgi:hypothetical protein
MPRYVGSPESAEIPAPVMKRTLDADRRIEAALSSPLSFSYTFASIGLEFPALKLLGDVDRNDLASLLSRFGLHLVETPESEPIPGSYWGDSEAGLVLDRIHARRDSPIHSILHETSHYVCMTPERRAGLFRDAGGDDVEEAAVCYLQILLSDRLPGMGRERMFLDMDAWGYSFRRGTTEAWFSSDSSDARDWLLARGLIDDNGAPLWKLRGESCDNE